MKDNTIMLKKDEKLYIDAIGYSIYCMLIPLNQALNFSGTGTINRYIGLLVGALIVFRMFYNNKFIITNDRLQIWLFPIWALITVLWSYTEQLGKYNSLFSVYLFFFVCITRGFNDKEKELIRTTMIFSAVIVSLWLGYQQAMFWNRSMIVTAGGETDPNGISACLCFSLLIALDYVVKKRGVKKIINYVSMTIIAYGILVTGSRGGLIAGICSMILCVWMNARNGIIKTKWIKIFSIIILLVIIMSIIIMRGYVNIATLERLTLNDVIKTGGNGRFLIWSMYLRTASTNIFSLIFGCGYGDDLYVVYRDTKIYAGSHSIFIGHLTSTGIIGLILIILLFAKSYKEAQKNNDVLSKAMIISALIICMTLDFFLNKALWNVFVFTWTGMGVTIPETNTRLVNNGSIDLSEWRVRQ